MLVPRVRLPAGAFCQVCLNMHKDVAAIALILEYKVGGTAYIRCTYPLHAQMRQVRIELTTLGL